MDESNDLDESAAESSETADENQDDQNQQKEPQESKQEKQQESKQEKQQEKQQGKQQEEQQEEQKEDQQDNEQEEEQIKEKKKEKKKKLDEEIVTPVQTESKDESILPEPMMEKKPDEIGESEKKPEIELQKDTSVVEEPITNQESSDMVKEEDEKEEEKLEGAEKDQPAEESMLEIKTETSTKSISEEEKLVPEPQKGSFLELDDDTRTRMQEIEDADILAEEEQRLAEEEAEFREAGIFAIKTSIGHEKMVANWLAIRARKRKLEVYAILSPPKLRGYLLLEGVKNKEALQDLIKGVQHARSVVDGTSSLDEIEHFLTPKPLVSGIEEGDVVEIIAGPFKGEKAKVTQIDESKEEITVELFEAMVSIPVTIRGDHVRILEKEAK